MSFPNPFKKRICACANVDLHGVKGNEWYDYYDGQIAGYGAASELKELPWQRDKVLTCAYTNLDSHTPYTSELYDQFPLVQSIASFYLLDVIIYDLATEFSVEHRITNNADPYVVYGLYAEGVRPKANSLVTLSLEAQLYKHELTLKMASVLRNYLHRAIVGELCHHNKVRESFFPRTEFAAYGWHELVKRVGAAKAIEYAVELFEDNSRSIGRTWYMSFGGKTWADIARVLLWYERGYIEDETRGRSDLQWWHPDWHRPEFSEYEFVDRVLTLEHNTGSVLNKVSWKQGLVLLPKVLDAHHELDLGVLNARSDKKTKSFLHDYWEAKSQQQGDRIEFPYPDYCDICGGDYCLGPESFEL